MKQRWRIDATPQSMSTQLQTYDKVTKKKISYVKVANTESISVSKHLPLPLLQHWPPIVIKSYSRFENITVTTSGPSSSCEMIILHNNSHGGIIRVCLNKNTSPYSHSVSLVIWPLSLIKRTHFIELSISRFSTGFSYISWKPRNGQLAKMDSFHQSKRSDNKWYAVKVRWVIFIENLTYCFIP